MRFSRATLGNARAGPIIGTEASLSNGFLTREREPVIWRFRKILQDFPPPWKSQIKKSPFIRPLTEGRKRSLSKTAKLGLFVAQSV